MHKRMTLISLFVLIFLTILMLKLHNVASNLSSSLQENVGYKNNFYIELNQDESTHFSENHKTNPPEYETTNQETISKTYQQFIPFEPDKTKKTKKTTTTTSISTQPSTSTTSTSTQSSTSTTISYTISHNIDEPPTSTSSTTTILPNEEDTTTTTEEIPTTSTASTTTTFQSTTTSDTTSTTYKSQVSCREKVENFLSKIQFKSRRSSGNACEVATPHIQFNLSLTDVRTHVKVDFTGLDDGMLLIYFPSHFKAFEDSNDELNCVEIDSRSMIVTDLTPSVAYLFCILYSDDRIISPHQCQSFMVEKGTPWILQKNKGNFIFGFLVATFMAFAVGTLISFWIIFSFPTLLRGSDKVIIVKKEKRAIKLEVPDVPETPIYLKPLPRLPRETPTLIRSVSDSTWQRFTAGNSYAPRLSYHEINFQGYVNPMQEYIQATDEFGEIKRDSSVKSDLDSKVIGWSSKEFEEMRKKGKSYSRNDEEGFYSILL